MLAHLVCCAGSSMREACALTCTPARDNRHAGLLDRLWQDAAVARQVRLRTRRCACRQSDRKRLARGRPMLKRSGLQHVKAVLTLQQIVRHLIRISWLSVNLSTLFVQEQSTASLTVARQDATHRAASPWSLRARTHSCLLAFQISCVKLSATYKSALPIWPPLAAEMHGLPRTLSSLSACPC